MATDSKYIKYPGDPTRPQPYILKNARLWGCGLKGDQHKLQELCNKYLNEPRLLPGESLEDLTPFYRTFSNDVFLIFDIVESVTTGKNSRIVFKQPGELLFCFPCIVFDGIEPIGNVWYIPFIYLDDNDPSIVTGREVYGFHKVWADFESVPRIDELSNGIEELAELTMSSEWTFKSEENISASEITESSKKRNLITIKERDKSFLDKIYEHIFVNLDDLIERFFENLPNQVKVKVVNLKQFRDAEDTENACYKAIIEAAFTAQLFDAILDFRLLGKYEVIVTNNLESHPFVKELGLQGDDVDIMTESDGFILKGKKQIARAFCIKDFDFVLGKGETRWSSDWLKHE